MNWDGFRKFTGKLGDRIEVVGDDIFVTNRKYIARGIDERTANSALIKLNQIGAVSETIRYGCAGKLDGAISFPIAPERPKMIFWRILRWPWVEDIRFRFFWRRKIVEASLTRSPDQACYGVHKTHLG